MSEKDGAAPLIFENPENCARAKVAFDRLSRFDEDNNCNTCKLQTGGTYLLTNSDRRTSLHTWLK